MNLRVVCLGLGLLSIAATGDPCDTTGSGGGGSTAPPAGQNGAVCETSINTPCCAGRGDPCTDDNDCCTGSCSGSPVDGGAFGTGADAGGTCATPQNEECTAALSSRCNTGQCACESDNDCCLGVCLMAIIPGTSGHRCCLESGSPCDAPADCCSLSCNYSGQCD